MPYSPALQELAAAAFRHRPLRELAKVLGVSHSTLGDLSRDGRIPKLPTLLQVLDRLQLSAEDRAKWLTAAGYDAAEDEQRSNPQTQGVKDLMAMLQRSLDAEAARLREAARLGAKDALGAAGERRTGAAVLLDGVMDLQLRFPDARIVIPRIHGGSANLSAASAYQILQCIEDELRAGHGQAPPADLARSPFEP